jgi:uncharacterized membrane protein
MKLTAKELVHVIGVTAACWTLALAYGLVVAGLGVSIFGFLTQKDERERLWHAVSTFLLFGAFFIGTPDWASYLYNTIQASVSALFPANIGSSSIIDAALKKVPGIVSLPLTGLALLLFCMGPPTLATYTAVPRRARNSGKRRK